MSQHDLSPSRFFRRTPSARPAPTPERARSAGAAGTGGWIHLRAWMRLDRTPRVRGPVPG